MRHRRTALLLGAVLLPVVTGGFLWQARSTRASGELLEQVMGLVSQRFVDTLATAQLYEKAARGLVEELNDPYSELLSPKELQYFSRTTGGRYGGIGMLIEEPEKGVVAVQTVYPNTPAESKGIQPGDRIVRVDTQSTRGWTTQKVSDNITGPIGTKITVSFLRPGVPEPFTVTFTRAEIHIPAVAYAMMLENRVGYVPLSRFNETAAREVRESVRRLVSEGAKGVILDMRGNPGGILEQSLAISNLFLKPGQEILQVRARGGETQQYDAEGQPAFPTTPLVVLTDEFSASASEIVAGALQDHDRALLVGETTFGKGLVQSVFNLDGGYALKLTTAKYYLPSGRSIHRERKYENGQFVEVKPDTAETEATKKNKPAFKSDAGRTVYGGGGVTPDIIVKDDTLTTAEQALNRELIRKTQDVYVTMSDYALELSHGATRDFTVGPTQRAELYRRLRAKGVTVDSTQYSAGARIIDRLLEQRVLRQVGGDSTAKRRDIKFDAPLRKAMDLLNRGQSQRDLFTIAAAEPRKP
jgi:carboxyl-terminal processing protease